MVQWQDATGPRAAGVLDLPAAPLAPGWMVGARTHLVDRFTPDCEVIRLAGGCVGGGRLAFETRAGLRAAPPPPSGRLAALRRRLPARRACRPGRGLLVDLRARAPGNWAHFLTNHLPLVFALADATGRDWAELLLVLPARAPGHVLGAAALLGLETLATDAPVEGPGLAHALEPRTGLRGVRAGLARGARVQGALAAAGVFDPPASPLPDRVFLVRRGTRRLVNEAEIAGHLAVRGFVRLHAEDLAVADQFRLFQRAEAVVAIHGAALAPMLYRAPGAPPLALVELFPCGHVTDVWRAVAGQTGGRWVGVRGRLRPEHVRPAQDLSRPFLRHSLQDFEADPAAIDRAFAILEGESP